DLAVSGRPRKSIRSQQHWIGSDMLFKDNTTKVFGILRETVREIGDYRQHAQGWRCRRWVRQRQRVGNFTIAAGNHEGEILNDIVRVGGDGIHVDAPANDSDVIGTA